MGVNGSEVGTDQVAAINCQQQNGYGCCNGQQSKINSQNRLPIADLWHWLVHHVPRSETDKKIIKFLLKLYNQKSFMSIEEKTNQTDNKKESQTFLNQF